MSAPIEELRNRLLAEHLGARPAEVREVVRECGSLARGVDAMCRGDRRLVRFEGELDGLAEELLRGRGVFDPERPIPFAELRDQLVERARESLPVPGSGSTFARAATAGALLLLLLFFWQQLPVAEWTSSEVLSAAAAPLEQGIAGRLLALVLFVGAAMLLVPVMALIVATGLVFGFVEGALLALVGSITAAACGYGLGRVLWRDSVRKLAGRRLERLNDAFARRGVLATSVVRVVPVAPFAIVNLVAGASRVRLRDFALGTALGMLPGTAALAFFGDRAAELMREPSTASVAAAVLGGLVVLGLGWLVDRVVRSSEARSGDGS